MSMSSLFQPNHHKPQLTMTALGTIQATIDSWWKIHIESTIAPEKWDAVR